MSKTADKVIDLIRDRELEGWAEYGATCDRTDLRPLDWINHARPEALDFAMYLTALERELPLMLRKAFQLGYSASLQGSDQFQTNMRAMLAELLGPSS
jgi:hypothetical protein